jgi:hypothetical protein
LKVIFLVHLLMTLQILRSLIALPDKIPVHSTGGNYTFKHLETIKWKILTDLALSKQTKPGVWVILVKTLQTTHRSLKKKALVFSKLNFERGCGGESFHLWGQAGQKRSWSMAPAEALSSMLSGRHSQPH